MLLLRLSHHRVREAFVLGQTILPQGTQHRLPEGAGSLLIALMASAFLQQPVGVENQSFVGDQLWPELLLLVIDGNLDRDIDWSAPYFRPHADVILSALIVSAEGTFVGLLRWSIPSV